MTNIPSGFFAPREGEKEPEIVLSVVDRDIRCMCNKLLAELAARPWAIRCPRCKTLVQSDPTAEPDPGHSTG